MRKISFDFIGSLRYAVPMYIETVPNRGSRPAILLREGKREGKRVVKRTLANLSDWPEAKIEALRQVLRGSVVPVDKLAIEAAFRGHGSLKHVWVVDSDVDIYDPAQVEWALATRFQADHDLYVYANQPGSSLDPSGIHVPGQKSLTAKMGLDCTIPWGADLHLYRRGDYGHVDLRDYLP
mgnify:CR=1 FL=1